MYLRDVEYDYNFVLKVFLGYGKKLYIYIKVEFFIVYGIKFRKYM